MKRVVNVLLWIFVAFCLIMALGMGFGAGSVLMLITAILALPLKPIRNLWNMILGIKEIAETSEPDAKLWQIKKEKSPTPASGRN